MSSFLCLLDSKETAAERARKEEKAFRRAARQARREARHGSRASSTTSSSHRRSHRREDSDDDGCDRRKRSSRSRASHSPGPRPPPPSTTRGHENEFDEHLRYLASLDSGAAGAFDAFDFGQDGSGVGWGDAPYDPATAQHVPSRWSRRRDEDNVWNDPLLREPGGLDDEAYAESIRQGIWERKNPGEKVRRERLGVEAEQTRIRLEKAKELGDRLERERIRALEQRKGERAEVGQREERASYERRWIEVVAKTAAAATMAKTDSPLTFVDIPWPVYSAVSGIGGKRRRGEERSGVDWLTVSAVQDFLCPPAVLSVLDNEGARIKKRKEILREAIRRCVVVFQSTPWESHGRRQLAASFYRSQPALSFRTGPLNSFHPCFRYHPDKFTRLLALVQEGSERARVNAGVEAAARAIGELMNAS